MLFGDRGSHASYPKTRLETDFNNNNNITIMTIVIGNNRMCPVQSVVRLVICDLTKPNGEVRGNR